MVEEQEQKLKLDLGCGNNKREGFTGVDIINFKGVDIVADLRELWQWADNSVDEVCCVHTLEHFTWPERVHFLNELYRVLKVGSKAEIITPHWSHACFYGDPSHQAPISEWYVFYLNEEWRKTNAPHTKYTCNFDWVIGGSWDEWLNTRNVEFRQYAMNRNVNSWRDLMISLIKK